MTARLGTCNDLAKNEADLKRILELFSILQKNATPASLLLPWFPSRARKSVKKASVELFTMLCTYVEKRRNAAPTSDAIDVLIADGEATQIAVEVSPASKAGRIELDLAISVHIGDTFCRHRYHRHRL
jgi:hypothetical protein